MTRRRTCTIGDARTRRASAVAFLDVAERLLLENFDHDVVVTNAVHAGIAASDSICCLRLGERSAEQDHASATNLLARVDKSLANELGRLLAIKTTAAYETRRMTQSDAKSSARRARKLVDAAGTALAST
jgi:triphosphoribosyl-dephospho-CoA synthetase